MSGGGGGGGIGSPVEGPTDCRSIFFNTMLSSPEPEVIGDLNKGDVLNLRMSSEDVPRIEAVTASGGIAGSILTARQAELVQCIRDGVRYVARVTSIDGGACDVEVRPRAEP